MFGSMIAPVYYVLDLFHLVQCVFTISTLIILKGVLLSLPQPPLPPLLFLKPLDV